MFSKEKSQFCKDGEDNPMVSESLPFLAKKNKVPDSVK